MQTLRCHCGLIEAEVKLPDKLEKKSLDAIVPCAKEKEQ